MATWWEVLTHWKRPWCWERVKAGEEVDDRGWDSWMALPTQWMRVWARRVGHNLMIVHACTWHDLHDETLYLAVWNITLHGYRSGFPAGTSGKGPTCKCRRCKRCRFDPWVGKIPWNRAWKSTPVFLTGESHDQRGLGATVHRVAQSDTTEAT